MDPHSVCSNETGGSLLWCPLGWKNLDCLFKEKVGDSLAPLLLESNLNITFLLWNSGCVTLFVAVLGFPLAKNSHVVVIPVFSDRDSISRQNADGAMMECCKRIKLASLQEEQPDDPSLVAVVLGFEARFLRKVGYGSSPEAELGPWIAIRIKRVFAFCKRLGVLLAWALIKDTIAYVDCWGADFSWGAHILYVTVRCPALRCWVSVAPSPLKLLHVCHHQAISQPSNKCTVVNSDL